MENIQDLLSQYTKSLMAESEFDKINEHADKLHMYAKDSSMVKDQYDNPITSTGESDKVEGYSSYGFSNDTLNWTYWTALYSDSWVFKQAIDKPAKDAILPGVTLLLNNNEAKIKLLSIYNNLKPYLINLCQWGSLYGGSIAVMMFDNLKDEDYAKPLSNNLSKAKTIKLYVTDRWYGCQASDDTVSDMSDLDFGKPEYYAITLTNGKTIHVHHDYIIRYEHRDAPPLIKKGMLQGWGYAEGAHILSELARDDKLKTSVQSLINKSLIEVIKMSGMRGVFMGADETNEEQLRKRLEMVNWARNFNSLTFLDKDDEYEMNSFSGLAGLADLLNDNKFVIAAALEMPGILYGDMKGGFSTDIEALIRYNDVILGRCEHYIRPCLTKLFTVLFKMLQIDETVNFIFNPVFKQANNKRRMEDLSSFITILQSLLNDGVIDTQKYAIYLKNYNDYDVVDIHLTDDYIDSLKDQLSEEMENINLEEVR